MTVNTEYRKYENCFLRLERYVADNSLCVQIWNEADGPVATITKCLVDNMLGKYEAYIDENNCPWAVSFIESYKIGKRGSRFGHSGYCTYPVVEFDEQELLKYVRKDS